MRNDLIRITQILSQVREQITDDSDMLWTPFEKPSELRTTIDEWIVRLQRQDLSVWNDINVHFLPASTFQEHSLQNDWTAEYRELSGQFDSLYRQQQK